MRVRERWAQPGRARGPDPRIADVCRKVCIHKKVYKSVERKGGGKDRQGWPRNRPSVLCVWRTAATTGIGLETTTEARGAAIYGLGFWRELWLCFGFGLASRGRNQRRDVMRTMMMRMTRAGKGEGMQGPGQGG